MTTRVLMLSHLQDWERTVGGIGTIVRALFKHLPKYDIELVGKHEQNFDVMAVHAGMANLDKPNLPPIVSHIHGLYWTGDYNTSSWEFAANRNVISSIRVAKSITVPTRWVAKSIQRDMRRNPVVIPHGIDWDEWQHNEREEPYILAYAKNRVADVCDPSFLTNLAMQIGDMQLYTTFAPSDAPANVVEIGVLPPNEMKKVIQRAQLVLSPIEETFGMLTLEAMAAGKAVVGVDIGGNRDLIQHGTTGFLYQKDNLDHMVEGILWAFAHRKELGKNARNLAQKFTWEQVAEKIASLYHEAALPPSGVGEVSVVIPCFNYGDKLAGAVESCLNQTYPPKQIVIVDDGSTDNSEEVGRNLEHEHPSVWYIRKENGGVARARNTGIERVDTEFVMCLDADDRIKPEYIRACITTLKDDPRLDIAYTKLEAILPDGSRAVSQWPTEFEPKLHLMPRSKEGLRGMNQIPTAALFRKSAWERVGGYDPRYCPLGAGAEDAEFWTRILMSGGWAKLATTAPLFEYAYKSGRVSGATDKPQNLIEPHWLANKPYAYGGDHPFGSIAIPKNGLSHPVHSYKNPVVSVIIPVGKGHEEVLRNAINSVEGQTYIHWELIVVWDSPNNIPHYHTAYPYIKWIDLRDGYAQWEGYKPHGAGFARNRGVEATDESSMFIVFLDADDELHMDYLSKTLDIYREEKNTIVYTDYARKFHSSREDVYANNEPENVLSYYDELQEAVVKGQARDYVCEVAQQQVNDTSNANLYHWALVTCLIPKKWHYDIGGFPEDMNTFEDVYYHWAMARVGKCYTRIEEPLVLYRMDTGNRRQLGSPDGDETRQNGQIMLQLAREKLKGLKMAGCTKCPGNRSTSPEILNAERTQLLQQALQLEDGMVYVEYLHPNRGTHRLIGQSTKKDYGYKAGGTRFVIMREDMVAQPHLFKEIQRSEELKVEQQIRETPQAVKEIPADMQHLAAFDDLSTSEIAQQIQAPEAKIEQPKPQSTDIDLQEIPGINAELSAELRGVGINTLNDIVENVDKLETMIGDKRARNVIEAVASFRQINVNMEAATDLFNQYKDQIDRT